MLLITQDSYIQDTCKIGQREQCCRYLLMGAEGFSCGRTDPATKGQLDLRVLMGKMVAQGDNCQGFPVPVVGSHGQA